jgi:FkbH-like protein
LPPGYSRREFEARLFHQITGSGLPFDVTLVPEADSSAHLVILTADFVSYARKPVPLKPTGKLKCLVWDLDNTLWDGTLIENDEVRLKPGVKEILRQLDERGILLSVASKNSAEMALSKLRECGVADYFLVPQIAWVPKSESIRRIAESLNIGLDSLAFIDDSPFELEEVSKALPMVVCLKEGFLGEILADPRFEGSSSADARQRRLFYQQAMERERQQAEFGEDYLAFLATCEIHLEIHPLSPSEMERVAELVQRTNQLNFSGQKYSRKELQEFVQNPEYEKLVLQCSDKFGSYGTVGFCLLTRSNDEIRIQDLMISCRIQGKGIEQALFCYLVGDHFEQPAHRLVVNFRATERNAPARSVLESLEFTFGEGTTGAVLQLPSQKLKCDFVRVASRTLSEAQ